METLLQFLLSGHTGKKVGVLVGMILGLSIVIFGFWATLFIIGCMVVGGIVGKMADNHYSGFEGFKQMFRKS